MCLNVTAASLTKADNGAHYGRDPILAYKVLRRSRNPKAAPVTYLRDFPWPLAPDKVHKGVGARKPATERGALALLLLDRQDSRLNFGDDAAEATVSLRGGALHFYTDKDTATREARAGMRRFVAKAYIDPADLLAFGTANSADVESVAAVRSYNTKAACAAAIKARITKRK